MIVCINTQCHLITGTEHSLCNNTDMCNFGSCNMECILYFKSACSSFNDSHVSDLSTHCTIKRCLVGNDCTCHSIRQCFGYLVLCIVFCCIKLCHGNYFCFGNCFVVSDISRIHRRIHLLINCCIGAHIIRCFTCFTCRILLLLHSSIERRFIHGNIFFFQNFFCQIKRKSIGVVQLKCIFARQHAFTTIFQLLFQL